MSKINNFKSILSQYLDNVAHNDRKVLDNDGWDWVFELGDWAHNHWPSVSTEHWAHIATTIISFCQRGSAWAKIILNANWKRWLWSSAISYWWYIQSPLYVVLLSYKCCAGDLCGALCWGSLFGRGRVRITIMGKWLNHRTMPSGGNEHGIIPGLSVNEPVTKSQ